MKHFYSISAIKNGLFIVAFVGLSALFLNFNAQKPNVHISPMFTPKVNGPAAMGVGDRTGSPVGGGQACSACHSGGSYSPSINIEVKDGDNMMVNSYLPGETYTIEYTVSAGVGSPAGYGMQSLLITTSLANAQAGTVNSVSSANTQISEVGGLQYIEHLGTSPSGVFTASWTAPMASFGNVDIFARGLAVNGTGNTGGDQETSSETLILTEAVVTSISYSSDVFCKNESNPIPNIVGETGGSFSASPMGLSIDESTGEIDLENSDNGDYTINYDYGESLSVSFELTIESIDISVTQNTDSLTANLDGATYQWLDCDQDFAAIDGETDRHFKATTIGNYAVEIMNESCVDTSECIAVTTIGIEEVAFGTQFKVYPNPSAGKIIVDLAGAHQAITYKIININGQVLEEKQLQNIEQIELDIDAQSGFYYLEIFNGDGAKAIVKLLKL